MAKEEKVQNPEEVKSEEKVQEEPQASKKVQIRYVTYFNLIICG